MGVTNWQKFLPSGLKFQASILSRSGESKYGPPKLWGMAKTRDRSSNKMKLGFWENKNDRALGPIFEGSIQGDRSGPWDPFGGRRPTKWGSGGEAPRKMGPIWVPFGGPIQGRRHGALARYHFLGTFSHGTVAHSHMALCRAHSHMAPWHILHMPKKVSTII